MPPKSRKAAPQSAQSHAADQLVAPLSIIECVKRMLSRPPLKAQSSENVDCLRRIDLADADIQLERVLSRQIARLADQDGDHHADVKEFLLFRSPCPWRRFALRSVSAKSRQNVFNAAVSSNAARARLGLLPAHSFRSHA